MRSGSYAPCCDMRALAALVIDRRHHAVLGLGDIELGDDAERGGGERHRPADDLVARRRFFGLERLRRRQRRVGLVDAGVNPMALGRVAGLRPFALRPHEIGEPRAIDELVDHPRRDQRRVADAGGAGRWSSSWSSDMTLASSKLRDLRRRCEQPASEMAIAADQYGARDRSAKCKLRMTEQAQSGLSKSIDNIDFWSWQTGAPAFS